MAAATPTTLADSSRVAGFAASTYRRQASDTFITINNTQFLSRGLDYASIIPRRLSLG